MTELGVVVEVPRPGRAVVSFRRNPACGRCGLCAAEGEEMLVEVEDPLGVLPGQRVRVAMPSGLFLRASALVYLVPTLTFLSGVLLGYVLTGSELVGLGLGVAFLPLGLVPAKIATRRSGKFTPRITALE
ncbi:MAG: hypothetical protein DRP94_06350 [Candidatus Latescibacterota bacterium]|nr:MAG: hypothetical protein DRP94_06350 [Candidatus Latescibacterota bacterium]RKY72677.1 MAG: hypothetical protein DRQ14_05550 [Candidatus Latescibacterota bacterium]